MEPGKFKEIISKSLPLCILNFVNRAEYAQKRGDLWHNVEIDVMKKPVYLYIMSLSHSSCKVNPDLKETFKYFS